MGKEPAALPSIQYFTLEQLNAVLNNEQIYENKNEQDEVSSYFKSRLDFNPFDLRKSVEKAGNSYHTTFSQNLLPIQHRIPGDGDDGSKEEPIHNIQANP